MRILSDDGVMAQVETDDGRIVNIASQQAPGTMEYLQGIQDIKPFSGPEAPVGWVPPEPPSVGRAAAYNPIDAISGVGRLITSIPEGFNRGKAPDAAPVVSQQAVGDVSQSPIMDQSASGPREGRVDVAPMSQPGGGSTGLDRAFDAKINAARKAAEIGQQTAIAQKAQYDTMANLFQQDAERQAAINQQRDVMLADRMAKYDQTMNEYSKMQVKNPWADASTGTKIGAALAMLVGAVGAGAAGQENLAMKVINQAIDKDIDLQLKNIDKKGNELGQQKGYLDMVRTQFADEDSRRTALRDMYLSSLEGKLKSIAANNDQLMASPKMIDTIAGLNLEREKLRGEMMEKQASILEKAMKAQSGGQDMKQFVPGMGYAYGEQDAKELRTMKSNLEPAIQDLTRLEQLLDKPFKSWNPTDKADAQSLQAMLMGKLRESILGPGTLSEPDKEIILSVVRNPTDKWSLDSSTRKALSNARRSLSETLEANARNKIIGYKPGSYVSFMGPDQKRAAAIQFIQQNPNDPVAKQLAQEMGLK